jgi:hypothetical protein
MPSKSMPTFASPAPARQRRSHPIRWFLLLVLVFAGSLFIPQVFRVVAKGLVEFVAWRRNTSVRIERVEGSLWEPLVLIHSYWNYEGPNHSVTRVEIARAEAVLLWKELFRRGGDRWFSRLSLRGVQGKIQIPLDTTARGDVPGSSWSRLRLPAPSQFSMPELVDAQEIDFVFQSNGDHVRLEDASFTASKTSPGELHVGKVTIDQPWLTRTFRNVTGKTALQGDRLALAHVVLEPNVELRNLTASPSDLARGKLDLETDVAAFDGTLRVEASTRSEGARGVTFDASGTFGGINIAKLASFLALSEAAGGVIKDGKFTFRGPPHDLARAQASLRLEAINFQWETRQWDSLTLGAMLLDRRLQVPQLDLRQNKNELHLTGELALPGPEQRWWQGDFIANIDARIENLTELSALLMPEFKYAAGKAQVEGSVRGRGDEFNGQLLVSGSNLTWRNAPIETLHAAVKLNGKEINIANIELVNGDDYLRGRGLVKLTQPPVYWGELRLAAEDLATYRAFLEKPILPEPLAGGAIIDWTGEASKDGYSGKFSARLRKVRSLGAMAQQFHPINAELEASYSANSMEFTRLILSDDDSSFTANVAVGGKAMHLQNLRFTHKGTVQLEGDALLPLDVWQQWPNVSPTKLINEEVVSRVQLTARKFQIGEAALLTGFNFPIAGELDGILTMDGTIKALKLGGGLTLSVGRIPLGWSGESLTDCTGQIAFKDNTVVLEKFNGRHTFGDVELGGTFAFTDVFDPTLALTLKSPRATVPLFGAAQLGQPDAPAVSAAIILDLQVNGPLSGAFVKGQGQIVDCSLDTVPDAKALWAEGEVLRIPPVFSFLHEPWAAWTFELTAFTLDTLKLTNNPGEMMAVGIVAGPGRAAYFNGTLDFLNLSLRDSDIQAPIGDSSPALLSTLVVPRASVTFGEADPGNPFIDAQVTGLLDDDTFSASLLGPLSHLIRTYEGHPPLTDAAVSDLFAGKTPACPEGFRLEIYPPIATEAGLYPITEQPVEAESPKL